MSLMAELRESAPVATGSAADCIPPKPTLPRLREAARRCRGCHLWVNATQTVFGEGSPRAEVMLVGEQPGDQEDRQGHPFVGPSGKLLDAALEYAGIERDQVYVTNSVKQLKFVVIERGRRLHKKPNATEVRARNPWLQEEIRTVRPRVNTTVHPSAVLRARPDERGEARQEFFRDVESVASYLGRKKAKVAGPP